MMDRVEYTQDGKLMAIVLLPNGKWMNEYDYFTKEDGTMVCTQSAGQYLTFEQAETMMMTHRPGATRKDKITVKAKSTRDVIDALPNPVKTRLSSYRTLIRKTRDAENLEFCKQLKTMCEEYCDGLRDAGMLSKETANEIKEYLTI